MLYLFNEIKIRKHYIVPLCAGGEDAVDNIVLLAPKERRVAKKLQSKMYPDQPTLKFKKTHVVGHYETLLLSTFTYDDMFKIQEGLVAIADRTIRAKVTDSGSAVGPDVPLNRDLGFEFKGRECDAQALVDDLNSFLKTQSGIIGSFAIDDNFDYQANVINNPLMQ